MSLDAVSTGDRRAPGRLGAAARHRPRRRGGLPRSPAMPPGAWRSGRASPRTGRCCNAPAPAPACRPSSPTTSRSGAAAPASEPGGSPPPPATSEPSWSRKRPTTSVPPAAALLAEGVTSADAMVFLGGANLGAAAYEYGLARVVRGLLARDAGAALCLLRSRLGPVALPRRLLRAGSSRTSGTPSLSSSRPRARCRPAARCSSSAPARRCTTSFPSPRGRG